MPTAGASTVPPAPERPGAISEVLPIVALVGRPNVGKSTLFNRLVGERQAITSDRPGTTRDRIYGEAEWSARGFLVVDTAGLDIHPASDLEQHVRDQVEVAVAEADVVVFMVDVRDGVTLPDREVAERLRRAGKPVVIAANKAEGSKRVQSAVEFYELGLGEPVAISAYHGEGTGDLLDEVLELLPAVIAEPSEELLRVAILGRPNVGKSALLNTLLGQERAVVSEVPGTTRDAIDTRLEHEGQPLLLVDTAGIRRRGRVEAGVERFSVLRALRALQRCDVALLVLDVRDPTAAQDLHIAGAIRDAAKGAVIVVNKWDLAGELELTQEDVAQSIRARFKFLAFAPIVFVSALRRMRIDSIIEVARHIYTVRHQRVSTGVLNRVLQSAQVRNDPPLIHGQRLHILYGTQAEVNPPTFVLFVNDPTLLHFSYRRYLENRLRAEFGYEGTAIRIVLRRRSAREGEREDDEG